MTNAYFSYVKPSVDRDSPTYAASSAAAQLATATKELPEHERGINLTLGELDISISNTAIARWRKEAEGKAASDPLYQLAKEPGVPAREEDDVSAGCNYPPAKGTPEFRRAAAHQCAKENGFEGITPDDVTVMPGGKSVLNGIGSCLQPGDKVLVAGPGWVSNYDFWRDGVEVVEVDTNGRGLMTPDQLKQALQDHPDAKAVLLNDPNNPTGQRYIPQEREGFMQVVNQHRSKGHDTVVVADDPYGALTYGGATMQRGAAEKKLFNEGGLVVANSVSKVYGRPDMRVGYAVTKNAEMNKRMVSFIQSKGVSVPVPLQNDAQLLLLNGDKFIAETAERMEKRGKKMAEMINRIPGLSMDEPTGSIYAWVDISKLKGREVKASATLNNKGFKIEKPADGAEFFRQVAHVAPVDGGPFYAPGSPAADEKGWYVRMVLKDEKTLEKACARLANAVKVDKLLPAQQGWAEEVETAQARGSNRLGG